MNQSVSPKTKPRHIRCKIIDYIDFFRTWVFNTRHMGESNTHSPTLPNEYQGVSMNSRIPVLQPEFEQRPFKVYTQRQLDKIEAIQNLPEDLRFDMRVVSQVLPFRVNEY